MREQLSLDDGSLSPHHHGSTGNVDLGQMSMLDLKGMLSHFAHQLGRSVAMATNNMDQLIDGQNPSFSPSNSGNRFVNGLLINGSLPYPSSHPLTSEL